MLFFYFFAAILVFLGYKSLCSGFDYLHYAKQQIASPISAFNPFVSIIVPCRDYEQGLEKNLRALFRQNYLAYEVIFVFDNENDKSVSVAKQISEESIKTVISKFVIAGSALESGQKVHNLREAVMHIADESEAIVFVDSDARPSKEWLQSLIAPLRDKNVGASTGYRWFVDERGGFATHLRSVWNSSIASALGRNMDANFCWGGSTAITREVFGKLNIREKWKGTLSDDLVLTSELKKAGMLINFVPQCLTTTVGACTFAEMLEFTTRQMKIARVYSPNLWKISFCGSLIFTFTFWIGVILLFFTSGIHFWLILIFLSLIFSFGTAKSWLRMKAIKLILRDYEELLKKQFLPHMTLWTLTPLLFFYNNLCALLSQKIVWRRIKYELKSPKEIVIVNRHSQ